MRSAGAWRLVIAEEVPSFVPEDFRTFGMGEKMAHDIASNYHGVGGYRTEDGILIIGKQSDLQAGTYTLAGKISVKERLSPQHSVTPFGFLAQYEKKSLLRVDLSDGSIITPLDGGKSHKTTRYNADGTRGVINLYSGNQPIGYKLIASDLNNLSLMFYPNGNMTRETLDELFREKTPGVTARFTYRSGSRFNEILYFTLAKEGSRQQEYYSASGTRLINLPEDAEGYLESQESLLLSEFEIIIPEFNQAYPHRFLLHKFSKSFNYVQSAAGITRSVKCLSDAWGQNPIEITETPAGEGWKIIRLAGSIENLKAGGILPANEAQRLISEAKNKGKPLAADAICTINVVTEAGGTKRYSLAE